MSESEPPERAGEVRQIITPRLVAVAILVAAVLGGVAVYITGSILHARDRETLATWQTEALPLVQRAEQIHRSMPSVERAIARAPSATAGRASDLAERVQGFRAELQRIRAALDAQRTPDILLNVAAATYTGVARSLEAVTALERELAAAPVSSAERRPFRTAWDHARRQFALGNTLLTRVRCRAEVERCASIPFEPRRLAKG